MTLKPSYLSYSAAKRLALFSPLLCLLLLTACAPQQSGLQHHQYSIVRYQDSLTALHDYRPPTREALSYTARRELQTAGAAVSQNGSNVRFTPIPDEEFDDGDIEVTPELLKEPSLYPALSLIQPIKETIRVTSSFGPRKHPVKRRRLMHAGVDIAGNRGEKVVASAPGKVVYSGRKGSYGLTIDIDAGKASPCVMPIWTNSESGKARRSSKASISAISAGPGGLRALTCTLKCGSAISRSIRCSSSRTNTSGHQTQEPNSANAAATFDPPFRGAAPMKGPPLFLYQSMVETLRASS